MSDLNITFDVFCLSGDSFTFYHSKLIEEYFRHFFQPPNLRSFLSCLNVWKIMHHAALMLGVVWAVNVNTVHELYNIPGGGFKNRCFFKVFHNSIYRGDDLIWWMR